MGKINIVKYPPREAWEELLRRPEGRGENLERVCDAIFEEVKREGDAAVKKYTWHFDRVRLDRLEVTAEEFEEAGEAVSPALREDNIQLAKSHNAH
jgi:histidinol dehydrogenase